MSPYIELKNISKKFGRGRDSNPVLNAINLDVNHGEFIAIIGFSGSGKSTLISLLSGLAKSDTGSITMDGKNVTSPHPDRCVVFQNYSLLPWLTVRENVMLAVDQVFPSWTKEKRIEHTEQYIKMVKLSHAFDLYPRELSGGMKQRVSLARGLAMMPKVLLLDEPLSALDALTRATLQDEISDIWLRNKTTVIWITNDPDEALLLADRVIPLLPQPTGATLGEPLIVDIERPRDRRTMQRDPHFIQLRNQIVHSLVSAKKANQITQTKTLSVPDILPEDLNAPRTTQIGAKIEPLRRSQLNKVELTAHSDTTH